MYTLTNSFHNSSYRTRYTEAEVDSIRNAADYQRTPEERAFVRRCRNALCGIKGCTCGNELGER